MINKIEGTKNGYRFTKDATNEDLKAIFKRKLIQSLATSYHNWRDHGRAYLHCEPSYSV